VSVSNACKYVKKNVSRDLPAVPRPKQKARGAELVGLKALLEHGTSAEVLARCIHEMDHVQRMAGTLYPAMGTLACDSGKDLLQTYAQLLLL